LSFRTLTREESGRVTKKRLVEKTNVDPRSLLDIALGAKILSSLASDDSLQTEVDGSVEPKGDAGSRAVSMSILFPCHVIDGSHPTGLTCWMVGPPPTVAQQAPLP
jgi:hypothetical protein